MKAMSAMNKAKQALDCAKNPKACIKPTVDKTVDCVKNPKSCAKKGVGVVKGMHKDLGGGVKGAAALAGIGATAALVPGGGVASPLLYKGAKKLLNPRQKAQSGMKFKEWLLAQESTTTASVATFARPVGMMVRRKFPNPIAISPKDDAKNIVKKLKLLNIDE